MYGGREMTLTVEDDLDTDDDDSSCSRCYKPVAVPIGYDWEKPYLCWACEIEVLELRLSKLRKVLEELEEKDWDGYVSYVCKQALKADVESWENP
jgi:hypothetical protein